MLPSIWTLERNSYIKIVNVALFFPVNVLLFAATG